MMGVLFTAKHKHTHRSAFKHALSAWIFLVIWEKPLCAQIKTHTTGFTKSGLHFSSTNLGGIQNYTYFLIFCSKDWMRCLDLLLHSTFFQILLTTSLRYSPFYLYLFHLSKVTIKVPLLMDRSSIFSEWTAINPCLDHSSCVCFGCGAYG